MTIFDEKEVKEETAEALFELFQGNQDAVMFCMELLYVYHLWDDLIDGDKERTKDEINNAFMMILTDFRRNAFYRTFQHDLLPLITSSILQWTDANNIEDEGEESELNKSYMLRANIIQIWGYCAYLIGGFEHYKQVGTMLQKLYEEDFQAYIEEFKNA